MKTLTYLPTLLALTIQVMVNGQTQDNQARKIRMDIMGTSQPIKTDDPNSTITISVKEYRQLLEQANALKINKIIVRDESNTSEQISLMKQIETSESFAKVSYQKFEQNREVILNLFTKIPKNNYTYTKAYVSHTEAESIMKIAKEMREEANAQLTIQAKYGEMSNAEEKEELALNKQREALDIFEKNYPKLVEDIQMATFQRAISSEDKSESVAEVSIQKESISQTSELLNDALKQAIDMKFTAQQLREAALNASENEKNTLINEAISLENGSISKELEVSELKAQLNYETFYQNRATIALLIDNVKGNSELVDKAKQLNSEAERLLKIGKEMREEANAQLSTAAKYGEMTNAEETELVAIDKQKESIHVIEKVSSKTAVASR